MPTGAQFEDAAAEFSSIGDELRNLAAAIDTMEPNAVVQGGRLGRLVPERIDTCARKVVDAAIAVDAAAERCRYRAAVIAVYEAELAAYEIAMRTYEAQLNSYYLAASGWGSLFGGDQEPVQLVGPRPRRPRPPDEPPEWATVARLS